MGKVKLTLTIEESFVDYAKEVAKNSQKSLSKLIEEYIASFYIPKQAPQKLLLGDQLRGIAKSELSNMTDKQIRDLMVKEKYGI